LAPLALLAAMGAVWLVVSAYTGESEGDKGSTDASQEERRQTSDDSGTSTERTSATPKRKTYKVRPGDTLALISERTGVTVEELMELNPDIDPNSLTVGEKIKLAE
jgi:LysM repeat protein